MRKKSRSLAVVVVLSQLSLLSSALFLSCREPKPPAFSAAEIERKVSAILELPTYEYKYRDVIYIADQASFLGFRHRDTQLLFSVEVVVQAGIDLRRGIEIEKSGLAGLTIRLPEPEILLIDADEGAIVQYFKKEFGGQISRLDYYDEISRSKDRIRRDAVERGILDQARRNAEVLVRKLLATAGVESVDLQFSPVPREDS